MFLFHYPPAQAGRTSLFRHSRCCGRGLALLLTAALSLSSAGCKRRESPDADPLNAGTPETETAEETAVFLPDPFEDEDEPEEQPFKTESVHVKADAAGTPREITVEAELHNPGDGEEIKDHTTLTGIRNREGDEEFRLEEDGLLVWENHGEDIRYEGTGSEELPVTVKVTYFLNGAEISPEELAGKSGNIRIRFDYENNTNRSVMVGERELMAPVPFLAVSAVFLPDSVFSDIRVKNGRTITMDDQNIVIGLAFPGMERALHLSSYRPTEEIELPDYVEIRARAVRFSLDFTATLITNGLFSELEDKDLDELSGKTGDMDDLTEGIDELADGFDTLEEGLGEFRDYLQEYTDGAAALDEGITALNDGLQEMKKQKKNLVKGADALRDGLKELNSGLKKLDLSGESDDGLKEVISAVKTMIQDGKDLLDELAAAKINEQDLEEYIKSVSEYLTSLSKAVKEIKKDIKDLDFSSVERAGEKKARRQVDAALRDALADTGLSKSVKKSIRQKAKDSIDLSGTSAELQKDIQKILDKIRDLPDPPIPGKLDLNEKKIRKLVNDIEKQADVLMTHSDLIKGLAGSLEEMEESLKALKKGVSALYSGSKQLSSGVRAFGDGVSRLAEGSSKIKEGSSQLADSGQELSDGLGEALTGIAEMADGIREFRDEGVSELNDLAGDDLRLVLDRIRAMKKNDLAYSNYSGIEAGKKGRVRFIIETDEIKK